MNNSRVREEPLSYATTGFKVEEMVSKEFVTAIRESIPSAVVTAVIIGFTDSKDIVIVGHDRKEGKHILERVTIEGSDMNRIRQTLNTVKKVIK
jgi:hypothetical protein